MRKREFLAGALGLGLGAMTTARAQTASDASMAERDAARIARETRKAAELPHRVVRTTDIFQSPEGYPNAIDTSPQGVWIGEQRTQEGVGVSNDAYLVDWKGKVLSKVRTESRNTSGMAFGDGHLWMGANAPPYGIFKTDLDGRTVSHRQIPLGPAENGGGCHGVMFHQGKLYLAALRMRGILRVDAKSWQPEFFIPCAYARMHGLAWDAGTIWIVVGSSNTDDSAPGLARYDAATGTLLETAEFAPGSADPHGLMSWEGKLYGCDAGIHPGWPNRQSRSSGAIFRIDFT
ncbi:MAG: hypothetical protein J0G94_16240 [Sphingomonadales bacterium]|nr:hypothetical protein [Sphingomonadales bacterium]